MTAPQVIERALSFQFAQSVSDSTGTPDVMQVSLTPLDDASSSVGATFAGGVRSVSIALSNPLNVVTFNLIPSYSPGLNTPILYRVMWRAGVTSRTFTYDFSMPDQDITFDELATLGDIIDGQSYLQQSDLGVAGRVARLNNSGIPITSSGDPVATHADVTTLNNEITAEVTARAAADNALRNLLVGQFDTQINSTLSTAESFATNLVVGVTGDLSTERSTRQNADNSLQSQITANLSSLTTAINSVVASTGGNTSALDHKADLDGSGHVPVAQIPDEILTNAFPAADQTAMLALSPMLVHKGSIAIRPDGVFLLTSADPTQLSNWVSLTTVSAVNGHRGNVTLTATDVNAIPVGGAIAQSQVTGLATALSAKADGSTVTSLATTVAGIQSDATLVHTSAGVIPTSLMSSDMVYLNNVGQLVKKDGTIIPITGGGGAVFSVNSKTGLVVLTAADVGAATAADITTAIASKADLVSGTVPTAQIPTLAQSKVTGLTTALSNKADLTSGLVPLAQIPVIPQSGVTGLSTLITNNQLTNSTNAVNRIASLEAWRVAGGGGGGGGGSVGTQAVFYTSSNTTSTVTDFTQVNLASPWGIDSDGTITGTTGTWYYLYTGVRGSDVAYPYITPNGHLNLRKWNEAGAADPVYALASDLATLTTTVGTKAAQSDLTTLTNLVNTKASTSALTTLSATVDTKAAQADLNATNTSVASKASQSALDSLSTTVAGKADSTTVSALSTTVSGKADASALTTLAGRVTTVETTLPSKADLVSGVLKSTQIPTGIPQANVTGLVTALSTKADLVSGTVPLGQLPNIPQSQVTGLGTALGNKADLVSGVIPMSQIPLGALPNVQVCANRAAMLALTTAQVQVGDLALVQGGSTGGVPDKGTYVLTGSDPSQSANWTPLITPDAPVTGVFDATLNSGTGGYATGQVTLTAASVGALAANASIPQSQVTGLTAQLGTYATSTALTSGLAGKANTTDVQAMFFLSSMVKRADYVATAAVASLSGRQSVDGVLVPLASIVLLTQQASSVNNGLWIVNSGSWSRPSDYATNSLLARDTVVLVNNSTAGAGGASFNYTIWQAVPPPSSSGYTGAIIDTGLTAWNSIGWISPPFAPTGGNGITVSGSTISVNPAVSGGLVVASGGVSVDTAVVPKKFLGTVPSGGTVAGISHNLNTTSPQVSIWDTASNTLVLAGVTVTSANAISIEFASAPASGQYRVVVIG